MIQPIAKNGTRTVEDSMGTLQVPEDALYGAQTQRAIQNFPISGQTMPVAFIRSLVHIKRAAALTNQMLESESGSRVLRPVLADAIIKACDSLLIDKNLMKHFPVDVYQTGSGTSSNMNANEVIATLATQLGGEAVSPNDHVNAGQSSNDVIPTAIHVSAAMAVKNHLRPSLEHLIDQIEQRADELKYYVKTGRTHLMDAMPVRMDQSLRSWAEQLRAGLTRLESHQTQLAQLALGGTAVGTGVNAHPQFATTVAEHLCEETGIPFKAAVNPFPLMSSQDTALALSGELNTQAASLMKIANDLRWMNSGPLSGLGEIELQALQPGSSIMPGKVNPVIPEAVTMVAARVMGNHTTLTVAGQAGSFELNVMLPLVASTLLESIELIANVSRLLADKAIATFKVRDDNLTKALARNPILVTALNPVIGYQKAAAIAKKAYAEGRPIIDVAADETDIPRAELEVLFDPKALTGL